MFNLFNRFDLQVFYIIVFNLNLFNRLIKTVKKVKKVKKVEKVKDVSENILRYLSCMLRAACPITMQVATSTP